VIGDRGESGRLDLPEARGANPSSAANDASIKDRSMRCGPTRSEKKKNGTICLQGLAQLAPRVHSSGCTVVDPRPALTSHGATEPLDTALKSAPNRGAILSVLLQRIVVLTQLPGKVTQPDALGWMRNAVLL
jgi:hypothetical protein